MDEADKPIGVFDSGVGGLTVVRAVLDRLPHERIVYLGDTARVPYGNRSPATIIKYAQRAADFLLGKQVKMILVACNTASAAALPTLASSSPVPVLGAVTPGAEAAVAATQTNVVGVLATRATTASGAYPRAIAQLNPDIRVLGLACPLWVPLIEEGWLNENDPVVQEVVRRYLAEMREQSAEMDTLVLGCTHYRLLAPLIQQTASRLWNRPMQLVDSATAMADATWRMLSERQALAPLALATGSSPLQCFVTDEARVAEVGRTFLGRKLERVEWVDL